MVLNLFWRRAIFFESKLWRAKHIGFCPPKTPHDRGRGGNSEILFVIHYLATTFFSPTCPKLGGPFMNAPRAIFGLFLTIFPFLRPRTKILHGEKIKCWKCLWRATFGPRLRGLAGHLPRHRGPFLARGPKNSGS